MAWCHNTLHPLHAPKESCFIIYFTRQSSQLEPSVKAMVDCRFLLVSPPWKIVNGHAAYCLLCGNMGDFYSMAELLVLFSRSLICLRLFLICHQCQAGEGRIVSMPRRYFIYLWFLQIVCCGVINWAEIFNSG
jgi:hypothetical protein